ncbi:hypothetical protein [Nocardioides sp. AX2bis]|uniref:hypothetical protein n=1 Tax=Nocardioides sp. AX2bis TaxID=2653157 RepID=UPI0012F1B9E9|nr:hypothetical protein [Nocardioides sp. AX2bis]VXC12531.1 conserved hypothetical protein [Nocardioides sp. AX2bis]
MNERLDLAALRDGVDLPPTQVAEGAWERGRRRVRRRRAAAAVGVAALVAAVAVVPTLVGPSVTGMLQPAEAPTGLPDPTRTVTSDVAVQDLLGPLIGRETRPRAGDDVVDVGSAPQVPLADAPLPFARWAVATETGALVLGPDGTFRSVDVPGGEAATDVLQATSFNPDATRLVLGMSDGVVVADLTRGTTVTVPLSPGGKVDEAVVIEGWAGDEVLVSNGDRGSVLVEAVTGRVRETTYPAGPGFTGNGTPFVWSGTEAVVGDARVRTAVDRDPTDPLLIDGDRALLATGLTLDEADLGTGGPLGDSDLPYVPSVVVVDLPTGDPVARLVRDPSGPVLLEALALDGGSAVIRVESVRAEVVVLDWSWETDEVTHVAAIDPPDGSGFVAWGRG